VEAKGGDVPRRASILKAVCGLTNAIGGYLILGAERSPTGWALPGLEFPHEEPATWLTSVLDGGLEPSPAVDIRAFERPEGRNAAVVRVPPVAAPPSITVDGVVYRRVSGQTQPVTSQVVLTELLQAGQAARQQAEGKALRAAQHALGEGTSLAAGNNILALALCPVHGPEDRAALLFSEPFLAGLHELVDARLQPWSERYAITVDVRQMYVRAYPRSHETGVGRMVTAYWDGAVAIAYAALPDGAPSRAEVADQVVTAWRVLAQLAENLLQGSGETHVAVRINPRHPVATRAPVPPLPIQRWTASVAPKADDISRVQRDLLRALGRRELEP
jgi:hypothetical protein